MAVSEALMFATIGHLDHAILRWVAIGAWGCVGGCYGPLTVAALPRLFGRLHLGAISGTMTMILILASALGPAYLAWFRDVTGTYRIGLYLSTVLPISLFVASFLVRRRGSPPSPTQSE
jgi:MFS family permease